MDLFLETPQQKADRILRQQQQLFEMGASGAAGAPVNAVPDPRDTSRVDGSVLFGGAAHEQAPAQRDGARPQEYSLEQETYRRELDYDRARQRRRKVFGKLKVLALAVLVPLGLAVIFLVSYALTCILNGATPEEVVQHLAALGQRLGGVWSTILQSLPG